MYFMIQNHIIRLSMHCSCFVSIVPGLGFLFIVNNFIKLLKDDICHGPFRIKYKYVFRKLPFSKIQDEQTAASE